MPPVNWSRGSSTRWMSSSEIRRSSRSGSSVRYWLLSVLALVSAVLLGVAAALATRGVPSASLAEARKALDGSSSTVSIVGDSTGNDPDEWVALWAAELGLSRRVELHQWLDGKYGAEPVSFGDRGDELTIWNAGKPGGSAAWAADQLDIVQPERPDLVIFNVGHNNTSANVAGQLSQMKSVVSQRWGGSVPQVVILQNPSRGDLKDKQTATLGTVASWAASNEVPTIDVTSAFTRPARFLRDDVHPNPLGSRIWADVVADALN